MQTQRPRPPSHGKARARPALARLGPEDEGGVQRVHWAAVSLAEMRIGLAEEFCVGKAELRGA